MKKTLVSIIFTAVLAMSAKAYDKTISTFENGTAECFASFDSDAAEYVTPDYSSYKGVLPSETASGKCLGVKTDTALVRQASGGSPVAIDNYFYIDMMAQFTPTESVDVDEDNDKLALYMNTGSKLVVVANNGSGAACDYATTNSLVEGTWYRITIRAFKTISTTSTPVPGFVVYVNGVEAVAEKTPATDENLTETAAPYATAKKLFRSLSNDAKITGLALTGVGKVDDIVFSETRGTDADIVNPYNSGTTTYEVVDAAGNTQAAGTTANYASLTTGVYQVKATNGGESQMVGTPVGVIKIYDTATDVLISVPWKTADGDNPTVADIVDESSLSNGDTLSVYSAAEQQFVSFTYNNGAWARTVDTVETTMDVNTVIAPGSAAYLHRTNTTSPICLIGKVASVGDATPEAGTSSAAKWSAFGSTVAEDKNIADVITGEPAKAEKNNLSKARDMISVPKEDGTFVQYFCGTDGKWYTMTYKNGKPALSEAPEGVLKAGRGFMYRSKGGTPSISFGNN